MVSTPLLLKHSNNISAPFNFTQNTSCFLPPFNQRLPSIVDPQSGEPSALTPAVLRLNSGLKMARCICFSSVGLMAF
jgi:hypothetical protein